MTVINHAGAGHDWTTTEAALAAAAAAETARVYGTPCRQWHPRPAIPDFTPDPHGWQHLRQLAEAITEPEQPAAAATTETATPPPAAAPVDPTRRARLLVAAHAAGPDDCRALLDALGLLPDTTAATAPPAA